MEGIKRPSSVNTRFLILSDTHGIEFGPEVVPLQRADVVIHCGDLTQGSTLAEYRATIRLLESLQAPLKLVIAGNHDWTLELPKFKRRLAKEQPPLDPEDVKKSYGDYGEARKLFEEASTAGIVFLDEGNHHFMLQNGAALTVYASPSIPKFGCGAFAYPIKQGHNFDIMEGVDVVITHGPPFGVLDYTRRGESAGSTHLFEAVARARPRLHCFGHIHEEWGAKLVTWRDAPSIKPSHFMDIDNERSFTVEKLARYLPFEADTADIRQEKLERKLRYEQQRCCITSHGTEDVKSLERGLQTLFVNAAIKGVYTEYPVQLPWLVEIDLPKS